VRTGAAPGRGGDEGHAALVDELLRHARRAPAGADLAALAAERLPPRFDGHAFLGWARDHDRWRFAVAEAAGKVCAKPREAALFVLASILEELLEEATVPAIEVAVARHAADAMERDALLRAIAALAGAPGPADAPE